MLRALAICPGTLSRKQLFNNDNAFHLSVDLSFQDPQLQETEAAFAAISSEAERIYQSAAVSAYSKESIAPSEVVAQDTNTSVAISNATTAPLNTTEHTSQASMASMMFGQIDPNALATSERYDVVDVSDPVASKNFYLADVVPASQSAHVVPVASNAAALTASAISERGQIASIFKLPASRCDIAQAVFSAINGTATSAAVGANAVDVVETQIADLGMDMDDDFDSQSLAQYAYASDEKPKNQESFARFLRMHFPEESAAVTASAETASAQRLPQATWNNAANHAELCSSVPSHISSERSTIRQPLFTLNARASTSHESIAGILARDFGSIGVGNRGRRSNSFNSMSKVPAAQVYEERLKQLSLAQQARIQSAPYVEISSDNISEATKISVNSMAQYLSVHLLPDGLTKDEQEAVSTVVTATPSLAQSDRVAVATNVTADSSCTAQATVQEQAQIKALGSNSDSFTTAIDQMPLQPMSTKIAILDAVATAPQRLHSVTVSQDTLPSKIGRSVMYAASECGRDPVLSSVSPQVAAAVAVIAAEERAFEQKAAKASTKLVNSITAQGHTVVTGHISVPLDEIIQDADSDVNDKDSHVKGANAVKGKSNLGAKSNNGSDLRIVRNKGNQAFVPSMEGVVSTDMSRRVQAHGALAAIGLRSSLNEAATTALGLDVSSQMLRHSVAANTRLGMTNSTKLNAHAMRALFSPLVSEQSAANYGSLNFSQPIGIESQANVMALAANNANACAAQVVQSVQADSSTSSLVRGWALKCEMEQAARGSGFSTATSRAALDVMQNAEALASLQDSLNLVAAPDLIDNEVLVHNNSTCIVTNSQRAKDYFTQGAQIVEVELARKRQQQDMQAKQPSTVISQYDVLLPTSRDFLGQGVQDVAFEANADLMSKIESTTHDAIGLESKANSSAIDVPASKPKMAASATSKQASAKAKAKASTKTVESLLIASEELFEGNKKTQETQATNATDKESKAKPKSRTRGGVTTRKSRRSGVARSGSKVI